MCGQARGSSEVRRNVSTLVGPVVFNGVVVDTVLEHPDWWNRELRTCDQPPLTPEELAALGITDRKLLRVWHPPDKREGHDTVLNWKQDKAIAEDGTLWAITPYPGHAGSPAAVTLTSTKVGISLTSHHLDAPSARSHAEQLARRDA